MKLVQGGVRAPSGGRSVRLVGCTPRSRRVRRHGGGFVCGLTRLGRVVLALGVGTSGAPAALAAPVPSPVGLAPWTRRAAPCPLRLRAIALPSDRAWADGLSAALRATGPSVCVEPPRIVPWLALAPNPPAAVRRLVGETGHARVRSVEIPVLVGEAAALAPRWPARSAVALTDRSVPAGTWGLSPARVRFLPLPETGYVAGVALGTWLRHTWPPGSAHGAPSTRAIVRMLPSDPAEPARLALLAGLAVGLEEAAPGRAVLASGTQLVRPVPVWGELRLAPHRPERLVTVTSGADALVCGVDLYGLAVDVWRLAKMPTRDGPAGGQAEAQRWTCTWRGGPDDLRDAMSAATARAAARLAQPTGWEPPWLPDWRRPPLAVPPGAWPAAANAPAE